MERDQNQNPNPARQELNRGRRELIRKASWVVPAAAAAVFLAERPAYAQSSGDV